MALRGAEIDGDALRAGGVGIYLNTYQRTRAWVGADQRSYAPGELLRGTAYLKNSPHHARRQLVLSQVDVYLSPECVRRKRNIHHETRGPDAKRQNLTEIYYTRRGGPGASTYKAYYNYGETIPPRESPFRGPYQALYHFRSQRFAGSALTENADRPDDDDTSLASSDGLSISERTQDNETQALGLGREGLPHNLSAVTQHKEPSLDLDDDVTVVEPGPIRCCVFKAARDGGPRPLPTTQYESPFRFQLRIPQDAPENYAWAEAKDGCCIEIRYRLFVVFKLRPTPRDAAHMEDPLYWEGAVRIGESPLIVLFAESYVGVDPHPDAAPRDEPYQMFASPNAPPLMGKRPQPKRRSILGRRAVTVDPIEQPCRIGDPILVNVAVKSARAGNANSEDERLCDVRVELVERALLKHHRKTTVCKNITSVMDKCNVDQNGNGTVVVHVPTDEAALYPSSRVGALTVRHELRVTLAPGERFAVTARIPVNLAGGAGRYLVRTEHNETLYPARTRQPPWRRERTRRQERERVKRENIANLVDALPQATAVKQVSDTDDDEDVCPICLDDIMAKKAVVLPCAHRLHADCIKDWMFQKAECPICKTNVS